MKAQKKAMNMVTALFCFSLLLMGGGQCRAQVQTDADGVDQLDDWVWHFAAFWQDWEGGVTGCQSCGDALKEDMGPGVPSAQDMVWAMTGAPRWAKAVVFDAVQRYWLDRGKPGTIVWKDDWAMGVYIKIDPDAKFPMWACLRVVFNWSEGSEYMILLDSD